VDISTKFFFPYMYITIPYIIKIFLEEL